MAEKASVIINSVDRALDILLYLYNHEEEEISLTKISEDLGIYKSTVYRTLVTLENKGFVSQNTENGKYSLGTKLYIIGSNVADKLGLEKLIKPFATALHDEFREAVTVSVLEKNDLDAYKSVIIYKLSGKQALNFNSAIGSRNDCYCAGVGKCLLAFGENIDLSVYEKFGMRAYTEKTITNRKDFEAELQIVREQGYALDDEEREKGLLCIAVPIMHKGYATAAISLSGPKERMRENFAYKIKTLIKTAADISEAMK